MLLNILTFLKSLSFIDYVFFFTVVFLIVLIISLVYFIKINDEVMKEEEKLNDPDNLLGIAKAMKEEAKPIEFNNYEKEQEDKAIISYDELLSNKSFGKLNYVEEEEKYDDLLVKKVDLKNLVSPAQKTDEPKIDVHVISLNKEEEFLRALKELQKSLI